MMIMNTHQQLCVVIANHVYPCIIVYDHAQLLFYQWERRLDKASHAVLLYIFVLMNQLDKSILEIACAHINRSEGLSLRDMLSLSAWRVGLGCSGKILPPPPSPSSPASCYTNSRTKSSSLVTLHGNLRYGLFWF